MNEETCYLCFRITKADVLRTCFKLWQPKEARTIGREATRLIRETYLKNRIVFCGKKKSKIIGGLLYWLHLRSRTWTISYITQSRISAIFGQPLHTAMVRQGFKMWTQLLENEVPFQTLKS